ncbi:FtsW/RodA/SpoVE family cell cycle protein [Paenibacillus dakarensis]|uniref:FtsW/RodA/SpoVE family cell cycle protein n=1 Tax=Paenibacillus dakarensis TaxID=1527293 RepID=UPI0006D5424C|nr:FtsW/RodA/SpoVE family cell cycle protein [Paenibacillus dakarensis]
MTQQEPNVRQFLDHVCQHVRAKELHPEIREEISGHIEERAESLQLEGYTKETAIKEAVKQMGSSEAIGKSLDHAHRPLPNWRMLAIIALMAVIGILAALNIQISGSMNNHYSNLFESKTMLTGIGLLALVGFYLSDYRKLLKYADAIFLMTLGLMVMTILNSTVVNGSGAYFRIGPLVINTMAPSLLLLLMSLAGMKSGRHTGWLEFITQFCYRGAVPVWLFSLGGSMPLALIYVIGYLLITWHANKKNMKQWFILGLPIIGVFGFILSRVDQVRYRISAFLNPTQGEDYQLIQTAEAIRSAGWTGHGFAAPNEMLPSLQSESLFPYLIYCFGWGAAIVIGLLVLLFLIEIWRMSTSLHDPAAQRVTIAFTTVLAFHMLWPILMAFGMVPFANIELPFMAYGGSTQILYFAAIGMVLSMYRRKNMLPSAEVAA